MDRTTWLLTKAGEIRDVGTSRRSLRRRAEKRLTTAFADPVQQHQGWSFARAKIADEQTLNLDVLHLNGHAHLLRATFSFSPSLVGCI
jgi:hypothetical protein